jgi:hypothetical protein
MLISIGVIVVGRNGNLRYINLEATMDIKSIKLNDIAQKFVDDIERQLINSFSRLNVDISDNIFYVFRYPADSTPKCTDYFSSLTDVAKYIVIDRNKIDPMFAHLVMDKDGHKVLIRNL